MKRLWLIIFLFLYGCSQKNENLVKQKPQESIQIVIEAKKSNNKLNFNDNVVLYYDKNKKVNNKIKSKKIKFKPKKIVEKPSFWRSLGRTLLRFIMIIK